MAARLCQGLRQVNRRLLAGPILQTTTRNVVPRVRQVNVARWSHSESMIIDLTDYKGKVNTQSHWENQELPVIDTLFPPHTINQFLTFISSGVLPDGRKTQLALPTPDEFELFGTPTAEWAPAPFNSDDVPLIYKMLMRTTSSEIGKGVSKVGHNIHFVKNRLWDGLVPVSASQWRGKDLSNPSRFAIAHEYLTSVIAAFEYMTLGPIRDRMRGTFNDISSDLQGMQDALHARRRTQGSSLASLDLPALWEEFIRASYQAMTNTAHSWVLARTAEVWGSTLDVMSLIPPEKAETPEFETYTERIQQLITVVSMSDFNIWMYMDGYNGYQTPTEIVGGLHNPDKTYHDKNYGFVDLLSKRMEELGPSAVDSAAARRERFNLTSSVQDELRKKIRGSQPSRAPTPPWIQTLLQTREALLELPPDDRGKHGLGIAIYRAAHSLSDQDWHNAKQLVESDLVAWGDELDGADELKPLLNVHWFDCKELGFKPPYTAEMARKHFQHLRSSEEWANKIAQPVFFMVDHKSAGSYTKPDPQSKESKTDLPGDFKGHVLVVDADFDGTTESTNASDADANPNAKLSAHEQGLRYQGHMRVLGSLVWSDLYPMLTLQGRPLQNLWPLAKEHPHKVYTGSTVPTQVVSWRLTNDIRADMLNGFTEWLKKKNPTMIEHVERMRKEGLM
ncbi:hypothetical protein BJY04DRAFT_229964 [Aspergillus karnatakaensis]|uniref:uncharacterized protein n=1 Tax=Aspergillus karnatakaensis TaxID=1810916 RepID=UPI003CCCCB0E